VLALAAAGCVAPVSTPAPSAPPNLLLITLDTVRADRIGAYGAPAAATPALDALARDGIRFEQAIAPAPLTLPAHATLLTGLLPPHHGLRLNGAGRLPDGIETLAERLRAEGYRTGAFVGAFVLDRRFGLDQGFDLYDDEIPRGATSPRLEAERPASTVVDRALAWLAPANPQPFFVWVHLYDAHAPYAPPEPFRTRFAERPYEGEIAALDAQVGRLLAELERQGPADQTVVAVAGDHGEALGEHGEATHGLLLYESTLRVPLLLRGPGLVAGQVVREPVSLADLAPTLAGLAGRPLAPRDGRDLARVLLAGQPPAGADVYAETEYPRSFGWAGLAALRRGEWKLISGPRPELYDLGADPAEAHDRSAEERRAAQDLASHLESLRDGADPAPTAPADTETRARLASLGYVTPTGEEPGPGALRNPREMVALFSAYEAAHGALLAGRAREAARDLSRLVEEDPDNPVFRRELARALRENGELPGAVELHRRAAAAAPRDPGAWYDLAVTLRQAGRVEDAQQAVDRSLTLDSANAEAHNLLGLLLALRGQAELARQAFASAVELDPRHAAAANNLGNALRALRRIPEAEAAYRRALELAPDYAEPLNGLGTLAVEAHRPAEAVPLFERALALRPDQHETRFNLAIAYEMAGDPRRALVAYREFLARSRHDPAFAAQRQAARQLAARLAAGQARGESEGGDRRQERHAPAGNRL
jgi:arylsulfatase A-like enzyme/Flp pilus assembly protein TadD